MRHGFDTAVAGCDESVDQRGDHGVDSMLQQDDHLDVCGAKNAASAEIFGA